MSGEGPESIPTSADPRSRRPVKKRALTPVSAQAKGVDALFARPDQEIRIPASATQQNRPRLAPPPEIVTNVQGSSAGAGSGEFHVYKASRRREYERQRQMDLELKRELDTEDFEQAKRNRDTKDDERTRKNREKREKAKARKAKMRADGPAAGAKAKQGSSAVASLDSDDQGNVEPAGPEGRRDVTGDGPGAGPATKSTTAAASGLIIHDED